MERDSENMAFVGVKMLINSSFLKRNLSYRIVDFVKNRIKVRFVKGTLLLLLPEFVHNFIGTSEVLCCKLLQTY